jgi:hypothetical protein
LSAYYDSVLEPFDAPFTLEGRLAEPLKVWAGSALELTATADEYIDQWSPYLITVRLKNVAPADTGPTLYNVHLELLDRPADAPDWQALYVLAPGPGREASATALAPGETLVLNAIVMAGIGNSEITRMKLDALKSTVVFTGGST